MFAVASQLYAQSSGSSKVLQEKDRLHRHLFCALDVEKTQSESLLSPLP